MALSCCKKLSALLIGVTSKQDEDFYCLNCFHSYATKNKLEKHHNVCKNHDYRYLKIPKHTPTGCSLFTYCSLNLTKNKFDCYRSKDCMERFCKVSKEHTTKIISYEKKEMI